MINKFTTLFLILLLGLNSCKKEDIIKPEETILISGETFNGILLIDGHQYDSLVIDNCIFENIGGDGLQIRDVDYLIIKNCTFRNIEGNAIRFRNSGSSNQVQIKNNKIYNIQKNGILAYETHSNTSIVNNIIHDVGIDGIGSETGHPHHGIYFQGKKFLISKNTVYNIKNNNGNCISVRSYGEVSSNTLNNSTKHGLSYYSDHPGNGGELLVENNIIHDNGSRGVNLNTNGNTSNHIGSAIIRFNTIITSSKSCVGVSTGMGDVTVETYGNILIRTDGGTNYIDYSDPIIIYQNVQSSTDINFVDFINRNLHINSSSLAKGFAIGISNFPLFDIDGENRSGQLDAGADEIN